MAELRTYQPSFTAGELSPALGARVDLAKYATGLRTAINLFVHPHGGASNRAGTQFINEVKASANKARLIPFQFNADQSYVLEFGNLYFRVYREGGLILSAGVPYEVATVYLQSQLDQIVVVQDADIMYVLHPDHPVRKISRFADDNWSIVTVTFAPAMTAPGAPTATVIVDKSAATGAQAKSYSYKVSAVSAAGEESLPSATSNAVTNDLTINGGLNRITWAAVPGAVRYIVYKFDNGVFGYIGGTEGLSFDDDNISADTSDTPQKAVNPFAGTGNYPRCGALIEQRLALASTTKEPQAVWMSQSANYENFGNAEPRKASDAISFRIKSRQVNEVRSMLALKAGMMVLTSGTEWVVSGGSQSDAITPSAIKLDNQGYRGSAKVQPIVVGNTVLFAQRNGGVVRDFSYDFSQDGFVGKDLTILARHLFENKTIKAWAYAQAPYSIAWVILNDGSLVSLTYLREHEVWAWTRHQSGPDDDAVFEDVVAVGEGNEDVPYFLVKRTIGGVSKRYIERLHTRVFAGIEDAFFVDCGLTYSGVPKTVFAGLDHLNGQSVVALADGNVVRNLTVGPVTGGIGVVLPHAASKVHVGLPMVASLQTLNLDLGQVQGLGTVQGRQKSISEVTMRVETTRGIFIGPYDGDRDSEHLVEYRQRSTEAWNEAIAMYTGDITMTPAWDWNTNGTMWVKQFDPLPMTILAIMPDVTVGR